MVDTTSAKWPQCSPDRGTEGPPGPPTLTPPPQAPGESKDPGAHVPCACPFPAALVSVLPPLTSRVSRNHRQCESAACYTYLVGHEVHVSLRHRLSGDEEQPLGSREKNGTARQLAQVQPTALVRAGRPQAPGPWARAAGGPRGQNRPGRHPGGLGPQGVGASTGSCIRRPGLSLSRPAPRNGSPAHRGCAGARRWFRWGLSLSAERAPAAHRRCPACRRFGPRLWWVCPGVSGGHSARVPPRPASSCAHRRQAGFPESATARDRCGAHVLAVLGTRGSVTSRLRCGLCTCRQGGWCALSPEPLSTGPKGSGTMAVGVPASGLRNLPRGAAGPVGVSGQATGTTPRGQAWAPLWAPGLSEARRGRRRSEWMESDHSRPGCGR